MIKSELSLVTVFLCFFGLWVAGMFLVALARSVSWRKQNRMTAALLPKIRDTLVDYLAGSDNSARLREFVQTSRGDVGAAIMSFEGTVRGSARDRLCELALDLALVHDWCQDAHSKNLLQRRMGFSRLSFVCSYEPCHRVAGDLLLQALDDPDAEVKLSASRALAQSGNIDEIERVFEHTVLSDLLLRTLMTEDLRRHAVPLCERAIPKELQSGDPARILATLQMVAAWERALPMPEMGRLLDSPDRSVRLLALRVAYLALDAPEIRKGILEALGGSDPEIASYAARAAGRLRMDAALPTLARSLRVGDPDLARAAAAALAEMPPKGWVTLQELKSSPNPITALAASEALARVQGAS
jgi:hypothetical protein